MSRATAWADRPLSGRLSRDDPASPGYSPSGVYGDPTLASADKGRQLLGAMLEDVLAAHNRVAQTPERALT
jgi:creatinine amidohydrolase/Fe(II)-dependent formamide hydrolase-like protein